MMSGLHIPTEDNSVEFMYKNNWFDRELKTLSNSHLINIALRLDRDAKKNKDNYELFLLDNQDNKMLKPIDDLIEIAKMDEIAWLQSTPLYQAIEKEISERKLTEYFAIRLEREEDK